MCIRRYRESTKEGEGCFGVQGSALLWQTDALEDQCVDYTICELVFYLHIVWFIMVSRYTLIFWSHTWWNNTELVLLSFVKHFWNLRIMQYHNMTLEAHKKFQISSVVTEHILIAFSANIKIKFLTKKILSMNFILNFCLFKSM